MRVPKRIMLMVGLGVAGMLQQVAPAHAQEAGGAVFVGPATSGLGHAWSCLPITGCFPPHSNFSFSGHGVGFLTGAPTPTAGPTFSIHGHGSIGASVGALGPYCELSNATFAAHWSFTGTLGNFHDSATLHWTAGVGSLLVLTGMAATSVVLGVAALNPPLPDPGPSSGATSCGAITSSIQGAVVVAHV